MKIVIQKVNNAKVSVENNVVGSINRGYVLLVGIEHNDTLEDIKKAADKIHKLRIFDDADGKMNLDIKQVGGNILSISQFTLAADIHKGNRPSFTQAMEPLAANELFERFNEELRNHGLAVETGIFQTHMNVELDNDGPVTIIMQVKEGKIL